ncbi:MAG: T9SS type A sorting domain-containing protein [Aureispira sp.]
MKTIVLLCSLLCCLVAPTIHAQTQIAFQSFEQAPTDTWGLTFSRLPCNISGDIWDFSTGLNTLVPSEGASFWAVQDLTGNCGNANGETLFFASTSVVGFTNVTINFDYDIVGFDNGDDIFYTVIIDGVAQAQVQMINGGTGTPMGSGTGATSTGGYVTEVITIPNGTSTVGLEVLVDQNGGSDRAALDNFILQGDPTTSCIHSVIGYAPNRGPIGTEVRLTGVGFTNSSTVTFNGVAATSVQFVSTTELIATAPATVTTGNIVVTESTCAVTAGIFTVIESAASCGTSFGDLLISEVYDNNGGSLGYIELYNGTSATIDLTLYQIDRFGNIGSVAPTHSYTFPTTGVGSSIAPGQVLVGRVGTGGTGLEDFVFVGTTAGFNANDRLELLLTATGAIIDDFHDAVIGVRGYIYRRNLNVTGPNPAFDVNEWTTAAIGDDADLGLYNVTAAGNAPVITTQPTDANTCGINLTIAATPSNGGPLTFQWFFNPNDGATTGWALATAADFPGVTFAGETTNNLQISGTMTPYDGYQFYCQVTENGNCSAISEAIQFDLTADRFFRSVGTGNWINSTTWETASSAAGPWSPTCTYPVADNSDYIHILATHQVTVASDLLVDEVVIEANGELIIANNILLEFANGLGVDLQVDGLLTDNGNGGTNGINFATNGGTWIYGANGTVVKTGSSSVAQYRDNYEGGIATVPVTATWIYRFTGNSTNVVVSTINMFYPNLYFESTNGNYSFSNVSEFFRGASGFATIKGNFSIGATGTGAVEVFNINTNANLMQVLGDVIIGGNGAGATSIFHNNQGGTIGAGMEILGSLLINADGQLNYDDGTNTPDGRLRLHGDWTDNNVVDGFGEGESTVEFVGNVSQQVNKAANSERFHDVVVNKPTGFLQNNASDMVIENDLLFTRGIVQTTNLTYLTFEEDATATGASDISHVDGPVVKETFTGTPTVFTYPTGDDNIYGPIGIETRFHFGEPFVAEYHNSGYGDYTRNTMELDHVSRLEYWDLDERTGGSGENLLVTLHWGPHSDVITMSSLRVAHFFTEAPSLTDQWELEGNAPIIAGTVTRGTIQSDFVTSFSPFTLGDIIWQASLPLDLLRFDVNKIEQTADIVWEVANEQAGDKYCLQRSSDGQTFENLVCFEVTQNENFAEYHYIDENPLFGYNYYRIHQVDYAGVSDYSPTKVLEFDRANAVNVFPNPAKNTLHLELPDIQEIYTIRIIDALGRVLKNTTRDGQDSRQQLDVSDLTTGTYFLQVETTTGIIDNQKITIVK